LSLLLFFSSVALLVLERNSGSTNGHISPSPARSRFQQPAGGYHIRPSSTRTPAPLRLSARALNADTLFPPANTTLTIFFSTHCETT
jgi:hypothetical protein